jgi:glycerol uptake facilitator-like aquaporin
VTRTPLPESVTLWRRLAAEFLGSGFLAAVVIGSGIAAQRLSPGDTGLELLENAAATAAGLFAIIVMFGPVSGGHFNPAVSFADAAFGGLRWRDAAAYLPAQVAGCLAGAVAANLMFARAAVSMSVKHRASGAHFLSEVIATAGLILVIFALARSGRSRSAPAAVGAYIGAAYFFTSSTSFANPAISIGRMFSDSFAGIAPSSVPAFVAAQVIGGIAGALIIKVLYPGITAAEAVGVIVPPEEEGVASATAEGTASATADGAAPAGMAARQPGPPVQATAGDRAVSGPAPGSPGGPRGTDG